MDRRTIANVADDRAYAFTPDNVVDRSGSYRIHLPFDTDPDGTYSIYDNDLATTYDMVGTNQTRETEGLSLVRMAGEMDATRVDDAYLAALGELVPLPQEMTLDELEPHLLQAGIDVDALVAALLPALSAEDAQTLVGLATDPIPLEYTLAFTGEIDVEPDTGSQVDVVAVHETLGVRPQPGAADELQALLERYPQVPAATDAAAAIGRLGAEPLPVFEYDYAQTPESVAEIAADVKDQRRALALAERWIPAGLLAAGVVLLLVGLFAWRRRPRSPGIPAAIDAGSTPP
jgi:hypothetical protein